MRKSSLKIATVMLTISPGISGVWKKYIKDESTIGFNVPIADDPCSCMAHNSEEVEIYQISKKGIIREVIALDRTQRGIRFYTHLKISEKGIIREIIALDRTQRGMRFYTQLPLSKLQNNQTWALLKQIKNCHECLGSHCETIQYHIIHKVTQRPNTITFQIVANPSITEELCVEVEPYKIFFYLNRGELYVYCDLSNNNGIPAINKPCRIKLYRTRCYDILQTIALQDYYITCVANGFNIIFDLSEGSLTYAEEDESHKTKKIYYFNPEKQAFMLNQERKETRGRNEISILMSSRNRKWYSSRQYIYDFSRVLNYRQCLFIIYSTIASTDKIISVAFLHLKGKRNAIFAVFLPYIFRLNLDWVKKILKNKKYRQEMIDLGLLKECDFEQFLPIVLLNRSDGYNRFLEE